MLNTKKILIALLFVSCLLPSLNAAEEKKSTLSYMKLGMAHPPGDSFIILPSCGLGMRFQKGCHGFDLSANLDSILFLNYASLKGMYLFYPQPEKKHPLYVGIGPGIGYRLSLFPMGQPFGSGSSKRGMATLEGVLGCPFRQNHSLKTFLQLELSQPALHFGRDRGRGNSYPGVALTTGIGF